MATVTLRLDGTPAPPVQDPIARLPRRFRLSRTTVEHIAALTDIPLPWDPLPPPSPALRVLGPNDQAPAAEDAGDPVDADQGPGPSAAADAELRRLHLLTPLGDLHPEAVSAMAVFGSPEVIVDVDMSVRRAAAPSGFAQVHSWQRLRAGRVTTLATAGSRLLELGWFDDDLWQVELARAVTVRTSASEAPLPAQVVDLPYELLLGTGEALRLRREDVFAELVRRHAGSVRVDDADLPLGLAATGERLRDLHASTLGRMQTVVSGVGDGVARKAGWVSWLLFPDGWSALTPHTSDRVPMVRVHPVEPLRLGVEVARLVTAVRG